MAELTAVAGKRTASLGKGWSEQGGEGDLRWPRLKTSSVQRLRGERALGDGLGRSSGRRQNFLARQGNEWTAVAAGFTTARARLRRPWRRGSEGERQGEWACLGDSVHDMEAFAASRRWPGEAGKQGGGVASSCARRRAPARLAG